MALLGIVGADNVADGESAALAAAPAEDVDAP
jgi:hypothetical protein